MSVLDLSREDVLAAVEAAAAAGDGQAERLLVLLLDEEAATGGLSVVSRLAARRFTHTTKGRTDG